MEKKKRKIALIVVALLLIAVSFIGVTYAIWQFILRQTGENSLTVGCFNMTFTDQNPISIGSAFPITEAEGRELTPYEFTIENTCAAESSFQINLEILDTTTLENHEYIRVLLEEGETEGTSKVLISDDEVEKTLDNATTSYKLGDGVLGANETKTYTLRMWLDEDTQSLEDIMGAVFNSKVTIVTTLGNGGTSGDSGSGSNGLSPQTQETITYIKNKAFEGQLIEDDETEDHNMRYIGATPNNYVYFNCDDNANPTESTCEKWQIIGFMNNIEDENGKKETRIKLMRSEAIGAYSWDSTPTTINFTNAGSTYIGQGINEWSQADIMKLMNPGYETEATGGSLYWERAAGRCYAGTSDSSTACDFSTSGLKDSAKNLMGMAVWDTSNNGLQSYQQITPLSSYELERSGNTTKQCSNSSNCNDTVDRTTKWTGYVGLMYPSDYGLATSGSETVMRVTCLNNFFYSWNNYKDCVTNSWIFKGSGQSYSGKAINQWTMMPIASLSSLSYVLSLTKDRIESGTAGYAGYIYPTIYLKSNVKIIDGDGSTATPFILSQD